MTCPARRRTAAVVIVATCAAVGAGASIQRLSRAHDGALFERSFSLSRPSEVVARVVAGCERCSWGASGREAAVLSLWIDGRYSQHLILTRGEAAQPYRISLGAIGAGRHRLRLAIDDKAGASDVGPVTVRAVDIARFAEGDREFSALARTPILYARPNTIGRFSDVPLLMWYETGPTPRGVEIRYSVVFSHEDGGTPTDRLMATWGRATDIEFVYGVELDHAGHVLGERFQGPNHEIRPFAGTHEGRHPLLWVTTDNNMVSDRGTSSERYAPAAIPYILKNVSREAVMDAHPWTYRVMAEEVTREGRVVAGAVPGSGNIPDPRQFTYVEACGELRDATLSLAIGAEDASRGIQWFESDGGLSQFRIARSGCFRGAVAVPSGLPADRLRAVRFRAFTRPAHQGEPPLPPGVGAAVLNRVNTIFLLGEDYTPGPSLFTWTGDAALTPEGPALVLRFEKE